MPSSPTQIRIISTHCIGTQLRGMMRKEKPATRPVGNIAAGASESTYKIEEAVNQASTLENRSYSNIPLYNKHCEVSCTETCLYSVTLAGDLTWKLSAHTEQPCLLACWEFVGGWSSNG